MFDPVWEEIHKSRQWLSVPHEEMLIWVANNFASGNEHKENVRILDIGCGQGASTIILSRLGFDVTALDGSKTALEKLNDNLEKSHVSAHTVCGEMSNLSFPDAYFDAVIDIASICMNDNCDDIFREVARVLKTGGGLFSVVPSTDTHRTAWMGKGPVTFFEPNQIKEMLHKHFILGVTYKCIEPEDRSQRTSHWLIAAMRNSIR